MTRNKMAADCVSHDLIEAIALFPLAREVHHCETTFRTSPFDIYATCPTCGIRLKVRSFSSVTELEDVFDAVMAWMLQPEAEALIRKRQVEISADTG